MLPINDYFFENGQKDNREKLFNFFYKLERDGSLDEISSFLSKVDFEGLAKISNVIFRCQEYKACKQLDLQIGRSFLPDDEMLNKIILLIDQLKIILNKDSEKEILNGFISLFEDQKNIFLLNELLKNDDDLLFHPILVESAYPALRDALYNPKSGESVVHAFVKSFSSEKEFDLFVDSFLVPKTLKMIPTLQIIAKRKGYLNCQMGSEEGLKKIDFSHRLLSHVDDIFSDNTPRMLTEVVEQSLFSKTALNLCKNLKNDQDDLLLPNFFSETPFYEKQDLSLSLDIFHDNYFTVLGNEKKSIEFQKRFMAL